MSLKAQQLVTQKGCPLPKRKEVNWLDFEIGCALLVLAVVLLRVNPYLACTSSLAAVIILGNVLRGLL